SAVARPAKPEGSVAIAAVAGKTGFTAFSSAGGGQLPGFDSGSSDRYRLEQWLLETAYQYSGFSWQQEYHWKQIDDRNTGRRSRLTGGYAQAGVFLDSWFYSAPEPLEVALRYSRVDPDGAIVGDEEQEFTIAANWFFNGHRNKLTLDVSNLTQTIDGIREESDRIRFQWDWSF
ncbi:MAG: porin, partial [Pseudomonadota bacterium]